MVYYFILLAATIIPKRLLFYLQTKRDRAQFICRAQTITRQLKGIFVWKPCRSNGYVLPASLHHIEIISPPHPQLHFAHLALEILLCFYQCVYLKPFEWGCQFRNEIVCAIESFWVEINSIAIKTWALQYLGTIMIMNVAGGVNLTKKKEGGILAWAPCWETCRGLYFLE